MSYPEKIVLAKGSPFEVSLDYHGGHKDLHSKILRALIYEIDSLKKEVLNERQVWPRGSNSINEKRP